MHTLLSVNMGHLYITHNNEVRYSMFAVPFSICCAVSYLFVPMFSIQGSLINVCRAVRLVIRRAVRLVIRCAVSYSFPSIFAIQISLFNVRRAVSHLQLAICHAPRHSLSLFNVPGRFPYLLEHNLAHVPTNSYFTQRTICSVEFWDRKNAYFWETEQSS